MKKLQDIINNDYTDDQIKEFVSETIQLNYLEVLKYLYLINKLGIFFEYQDEGLFHILLYFFELLI